MNLEQKAEVMRLASLLATARTQRARARLNDLTTVSFEEASARVERAEKALSDYLDTFVTTVSLRPPERAVPRAAHALLDALHRVSLRPPPDLTPPRIRPPERAVPRAAHALLDALHREYPEGLPFYCRDAAIELLTALDAGG